MFEADHSLDATGLTCPMPLLKARQALRKLHTGETLEVRATDAGAVRDIPAYINQTQHRLLGSRETVENNQACYGFLIQVCHDEQNGE